jgi:transcriptional regulator with XRE-family HTH domain
LPAHSSCQNCGTPLTPRAGSAGRRSHLAPVLTSLHRASRLPLRLLAARLGISCLHASQILSGERFPGWRLTERFARACGADPLVLRKVWEDERFREDPSLGRRSDPASDAVPDAVPGLVPDPADDDAPDRAYDAADPQ